MMNLDEQKAAILTIKRNIAARCEELIQIAIDHPPIDHPKIYTIKFSAEFDAVGGYTTTSIMVTPLFRKVKSTNNSTHRGFKYESVSLPKLESTGTLDHGGIPLLDIQKYLEEALPLLRKQIAEQERKLQEGLDKALKSQYTPSNATLSSFLTSKSQRIRNIVVSLVFWGVCFYSFYAVCASFITWYSGN